MRNVALLRKEKHELSTVAGQRGMYFTIPAPVPRQITISIYATGVQNNYRTTDSTC